MEEADLPNFNKKHFLFQPIVEIQVDIRKAILRIQINF